MLTLTKSTSLMPELNPKDPLAALGKVVSLPVGAKIKVVSVGHQSTTPWYQVKVFAKGRHLTGWINSVALTSQVDQ